MDFPRLTREVLQSSRRRRCLDQQQLDRQLIDVLLDFESRELETLTPAAWDALRENLERFHPYDASGTLPPSTFRHIKRRAACRRLRHLSGAEIRRMQTTLQHVLGELRPLRPETVATTSYPRLPLRSPERRLGTSSDTSSAIYDVDVADWPDTFWFSVRRLLKLFAQRLRRCPAPGGKTQCGRLFVRTGRGKFCSTKCANRARSREWYHKNLERARQRRRLAHERDVRKATGPHVKVGRRGHA
jgi:hypothetical protein